MSVTAVEHAPPAAANRRHEAVRATTIRALCPVGRLELCYSGGIELAGHIECLTKLECRQQPLEWGVFRLWRRATCLARRRRWRALADIRKPVQSALLAVAGAQCTEDEVSRLVSQQVEVHTLVQSVYLDPYLLTLLRDLPGGGALTNDEFPVDLPDMI